MFVQLYKPRPELRSFVSRIVITHFQLDCMQPEPVYPFVPQPEQFISFYPYDTPTAYNYATENAAELGHTVIVGPQLSRFKLTYGRHSLIIVVQFHAGGLHRLLRLPMAEIMNTPLDATLLLGREVETVTEQLGRAADYEKMADIVQYYLLKKMAGLKPMLPVDQVLMEFMQHKNLIDVDQLAKQACVSTRQLERQCRERTGMSPKTFARLVRFSRAWIMHDAGPQLSWLEIAHTCGYADQMHMIRDFKDFAGITPTILQHDLEKYTLRYIHRETAKFHSIYF